LAYIGKVPANAPLTSSDIADGIISTADLANTAVTGAKVNTDVISAQTALATAPADTDEFLVSDAGTIKRIDYSLIKGGGAFEKLVTTTVSSAVSELVFNNTYFTTTHTDYQLRIVDFRGSSGAVPRFTISSDNGSNYKGGSGSTGYRFSYSGIDQSANSTTRGSGGSDDANFILPIASDGFHGGSTQATSLIIDIFDPLNTLSDTKMFNFMASAVCLESNDEVTFMIGGGVYMGSGDEDTAFNAIKIFMDSGNIDGGTFTLYGRKI
jgi:hypothetical protein|tara:strand:+ start:1964 stop:2764 length:801 start_codon:yes stop_codon:yes gene_type:complete